MTHAIEFPSRQVSRRGFLTISATTGGAMLMGIGLGADSALAARGNGELEFAPSAWLRIAPDGTVTMTMGYIEMGQGTYTSIPMLIAEELEIDLANVRVEHAPPDDKRFMNPALGFQVTGGSTTIRAAYEPMRRAGATARTMLVQAAAARWGVSEASCTAARGSVMHGASGRRLAYGDLVGDAAKLPVPETVTLKPASAFQFIGKPVKRLDAPGKVNGTAVYGIDVRLPGMKIATLAQSPVPGGRVRAINESAAMAVRGVRQVVRLDDAVAVVADHMGAAKKGLAALDVQWDDGSNGGYSMDALLASMKEASARGGVVVRKEGDFEGALGSATRKLQAVYELPFLIHAAMEPLNCTVHVQRDRCEVWVGTQVLTRAQAAAAMVSGLPIEKVTVHNHLLGGGFGRRLEVDSIERAVQIGKQVTGPVKVVWTREEDTRHDMYRPYFYDEVEAGLDASGRPVAWRHRITGSSILKRWAPPLYQNGFDPETIDGAAQPPYAFANIRVEYQNHEPPIPTAFWRGVGPTHNVFVVESFFDELAAAGGADPVAYRLASLEGNPRAAQVLRVAAERAGWGRPVGRREGRGVSLQFAFGSYMAMVTEVAVTDSGEVTVRRVTVAVDAGTIVNPDTVIAQVQGGVLFGMSAALWGQATLKDGRVQESNFHDVRIVRMNETPAIDVVMIPSSDAPGGMGEPGTSGFAPSLTNAIFAATGKRVRKLPIDTAQLAQA